MNKNKFSNTNSKNIIIIIVLFLIVFGLSSYIFFKNYSTALVNNSLNNYTLHIDSLNSKLKVDTINNNKQKIEENINKTIKSNLFDSISFRYEKFIFDKNTLIDSIQDFDDKSWSIAEVIVDARYGFITKVKNTSLYEFIPSSSFDNSQAIQLRFEVYKKSSIKNIVTKLDFSGISKKKSFEPTMTSWFDSLVSINNIRKDFEIKVDNTVIGNITYKLNTIFIQKDLESFFMKLVIFNIIMFLPILILLSFYHKYLFKRYVTTPIEYLNEYLDDILKDKFSNIDKTHLEGTPETKELTKRISKISSKLAALRNELNINKESLELKVSTDDLTGLPNKNIFDFDIKSMYISFINGYVFIIKMEQLGYLSNKHDNTYINSFIESYVNIIKNIIFRYSKIDIKLYRFYGSQFSIIARNMNLENAQKMCEDIIDELQDRLPDMYDTPENLVQIGGVAFDLYGSLDSVLVSLNDSYDESQKKGFNSYNIIGEVDISKNYDLLDNTVVEVINRNEFKISFVLESFLFDDPRKIIMTEARPILIDNDNNELSIGSFISVAQKLNIANDFDKKMILKVIEYIKSNNITHEIAINISINSIEDNEFIKWLGNTLKKNITISKNIVFSITSYTAYLHKTSFQLFIKDIHRVGTKILLKRYKTDEYPLNQLDNLQLDYIRMNKDYTANFTNDIIKKHKVKNILIYAELNNIRVITDSVELDADYDLLDRLGTYATSR